MASRWEELVQEHLATSARANSADGWKYKQDLVDQFPFLRFWDATPAMLRVYAGGEAKLVSLQELRAEPVIASVAKMTKWVLWPDSHKATVASNPPFAMLQNDQTPVLTEDDLRCLSDTHRALVFSGRQPSNLRWTSPTTLTIDWVLCVEEELLPKELGPVALVALPDDDEIGWTIHKTTDSVHECALLNDRHPFVRWFRSVKEACEQGCYGVGKPQFDRLMLLVQGPLRYAGHRLPELQAYLDAWRQWPGLPAELYPPAIKLERRMFCHPVPGALSWAMEAISHPDDRQ